MDTRTLFPVSPDSTSIGLTRLEAFAVKSVGPAIAWMLKCQGIGADFTEGDIAITACDIAQALEKECDRIQAERVKGSV